MFGVFGGDSQSQAGPAAHGKNGPGGDLPQAADHHRGDQRSGLPLLAPRSGVDPVNEVWSSDITYVPMRHGFMYLTAVIDWHSRYVLSWQLSNTLEGQFCLEALDDLPDEPLSSHDSLVKMVGCRGGPRRQVGLSSQTVSSGGQ